VLVESLKAVLERTPGVRLAILFGSWARDEAGPASDLDVALWPQDGDLSLAAESSLQAELERATGKPVDLVRLDRADTMVQWRVARDGVLLQASTPVEFVRFRAAAASEHADFAPAQRLAARAYRRRLVAQEKGSA